MLQHNVDPRLLSSGGQGTSYLKNRFPQSQAPAITIEQTSFGRTAHDVPANLQPDASLQLRSVTAALETSRVNPYAEDGNPSVGNKSIAARVRR